MPVQEPFMFRIMPVLFIVIFVIVIGGFLFVALSGLSRWLRNNRQPVQSGHVIVVDKRTHVWGGGVHHAGAHHHRHTRTSYYVTFEYEDGERQEFAVSGREYGQIASGDTGTLTYQGTRFHNFDRV